MASKAKLLFKYAPEIGWDVLIDIDTGTSIVHLKMVFTTVRYRRGQVTYSSTISGAVNNFITAWNLDYKNYAKAFIDTGTDSLELLIENPSWKFDSITGSAVDNTSINVTIENQPIVPPKTLSFEKYIKGSSSPCNNAKAKYTAEGADAYNVYVDSVLKLSNKQSPFEVPLTRGVANNIRVVDESQSLVGTHIARAPRKINSGDINIFVSNFNTGANVEISTDFISDDIIPLSYSLDGINYKASSTFTGIAEGNYTLHVKDDWGCVTEKTFVVDGETEITETIFNISDINPLRYAKYEEGKKNYRNTLSFQEVKSVRRCFSHKYLEGDEPITQFKTNAQYIEAFILDPEGNATTLPIIKYSDNIGIEAKSTATYFDLGGGRSGVYFGVVDKLEPLTNDFIETVNYGFTLPEWANKEGDYVTIDGLGQVPIAEVGYSDFYQSFILEFAIPFTGEPEERNIYAKYNRQPYELYQFKTPVLLDSFNVVIEAGKSSSDIDFTYISENIKKVEDYEKLYEIRYYNDTNLGDMVYKTGVEHLIRLDGFDDYVGEQSVEGYDGDDEFYHTDNKVYRSFRFTFPYLSSEMCHKVRLIATHKFLSINNILYKLSEAPEINPLPNTNSKSISLLLKSGGELFMSNDQEIITGSVEDNIIGGAIEASKGKSLILWTKNNG